MFIWSEVTLPPSVLWILLSC